jgi:hypothetical protein
MALTINFGKGGGLSAYAKRRLKRLAMGKTLASRFMKARTQKQRGQIARAAKRRR